MHIAENACSALPNSVSLGIGEPILIMCLEFLFERNWFPPEILYLRQSRGAWQPPSFRRLSFGESNRIIES